MQQSPLLCVKNNAEKKLDTVYLANYYYYYFYGTQKSTQYFMK